MKLFGNVLRRVGSVYGSFLSGFLGSIFDLFLDAALLVRDVFQRVCCPSKVVFGPFLARLFTVHFIGDAT
jgi:hypothetical protein